MPSPAVTVVERKIPDIENRTLPVKAGVMVTGPVFAKPCMKNVAVLAGATGPVGVANWLLL
jgi:hypothetical protein